MRILVLNWKDHTHPAAGGAEVYTRELCRAWARDGHQVTWFSSQVAGRPTLETIEGVRHVRGGGRLTVYRAARQWVQAQGSAAFDLVIDEVNTRPFLTPDWLVGTPSVALIHQLCREIWWHEVPLPVAVAGRFLLERRWLRRYADTPVLTVSASSKESLESYGLRRVVVVPEGVPQLTRPDLDRADAPTLLFVGRLASNKRPGDALRAHALVRDQHPSAQLWVVGDGPQAPRLRRLAGEGVTFHGRVDERRKHELMAAAHVLLVTSVREGWGLVVDESAAMGTPTIGYRVPGLVDSVPAAGGTLVDPSPGALAAEVVRQLPELVGAPANAGWNGGALPWDEVAAQFLAVCSGHAQVLRGRR